MVFCSRQPARRRRAPFCAGGGRGSFDHLFFFRSYYLGVVNLLNWLSKDLVTAGVLTTLAPPRAKGFLGSSRLTPPRPRPRPRPRHLLLSFQQQKEVRYTKSQVRRNTRARFYDTLSSRTRSKSLERTRCPPSSSVPHLTLPSTLSTRRRRRSRWFPKTRLCLSCSLFYRRRPIPKTSTSRCILARRWIEIAVERRVRAVRSRSNPEKAWKRRIPCRRSKWNAGYSFM